MPLPTHYLLSNLLHLKVRCNQGLDYGIGIMGWMHPPVHRLLGWASKASNLSLDRYVWRLDQLKSITYQNALVKGLPSQSDQGTIARFPTLLDADLLNIQGEKIANIADLVFDTKSGEILYYLVSRTNYKLPGTSRWRFDISRIIDQEPGCVSSNINTLEEIPIIKSSFKQDLLNKSKKVRENIYQFSNIANEKFEGWLDDIPSTSIYNNNSTFDKNLNTSSNNTKDIDDLDKNEDYIYSRRYNSSDDFSKEDEDPWI